MSRMHDNFDMMYGAIFDKEKWEAEKKKREKEFDHMCYRLIFWGFAMGVSVMTLVFQIVSLFE